MNPSSTVILLVSIAQLLVTNVSAFLPWGVSSRQCSSHVMGGLSPLRNSVETATETDVEVTAHVEEANGFHQPELELPSHIVRLTAAEINERLAKQLEKLREKDSKSPVLSKQDLKVVYSDESIVVIDKPAGVLSVGKDRSSKNNLASAVYEAFKEDLDELKDPSQMVVHRLGMDTSGLLVFAKSLEAVRGMNTLFRTRKIERMYEALVVGHIADDEGTIDLPLMRDYEFPPFMRVSTMDHQRALLGLEAEDVGKKLLEHPKGSITQFTVLSREEFQGEPVTRVALRSVSGRTHQLNVHLAAFGHPILGDSTYGLDGDAAPNGGLTDEELEELIPNPQRADAELQKRVAELVKDKSFVHAKSLKFRHPVTKETVSLSTDAPF